MIPAFFIHLLMNMWLLTSYTIFPENYTSTEVDIGGTATTIFVGEEVSAFKRVSSIINFEQIISPQSIPFFVFGILSLVTILLLAVIQSFIDKLVRKDSKKKKDDQKIATQGTFEDGKFLIPNVLELESMKSRGLVSYDPKSNPTYSLLIYFAEQSLKTGEKTP